MLTSASFAALDLSQIGMGARPLGLGGVAALGYDDATSIFTNPAGLAASKGVKAVSMSGKMFQDVNYFMLGASDLSPIGNLGIGYVNASVPSIPLTTVEGTGASRKVIQSGLTDYSNSLIAFSYATELSRIFRGKGEKIYFGANLKWFLQGFSGGGTVMQDATGAGMDLDLGLMAQPNSWLGLGLKLNNVLPTNLGGKFTWQKNSYVEGIPMTYRLGAKLNLLGPTAMRKASQVLNWSFDYENFGENNYPSAWHTGLEFLPLPALTLRVGIDQKPKAESSCVGVESNLTAGVGLMFYGIAFDYAYHQFGDVGENATHFLSIGYRGQVRSEDAQVAQQKKKSQISQINVVPKPTIKPFIDVADNYWAKRPIEYMSALKIMAGYPDDTFHPDQAITKGELVSILNKAKGFKPSDQTARKYFSSKFDPRAKVTRSEAAKILANFSGLYQKDSVDQKVYFDVSKDDPASPAIAASKEAGFFEFLSNNNFEGNKYITRAETAEMLSKVPFIKEKIKKLISGE